jgi:hypothetical protein
MSWKDRISTVISLEALLISATSSYFTFFRASTAVDGAVLGVALHESTATMSVAVLNTGNRQVALTDANLYLIQADRSEVLRHPLAAVRIASAKAPFPLPIEPGKLVFFEITADLPWQSVIAYRQEVEPGDDHTHRTAMGVNIEALSATGIRLAAEIDAVEIQLRDSSLGGYKVNSEVRAFAPIQRRAST